MVEVALANEQSTHAVDEARLIEAARRIVSEEGFRSASISLAVVDDPTIHKLNRQFLNHDYPTDVLSFVLEVTDKHLDGEVIVSADTAAARAPEFGWDAPSELLLYVIHGVLHLTGYDDKSPATRRAMREQEAYYLAQYGLPHPYSDDVE